MKGKGTKRQKKVNDWGVCGEKRKREEKGKGARHGGGEEEVGLGRERRSHSMNPSLSILFFWN